MTAVFAAATALPGRERSRTFTRIGAGEGDDSAGRLDIVGAAVLSVLAGSLITLLQAHSAGLPAPATGGGALEAGALLVPAAACSALTGRLAGVLTGRFTSWRVSAGLAALTSVGVLVVAVFSGPIPVVVGAGLTVCGFAGAQAVLVGLVPVPVALAVLAALPLAGVILSLTRCPGRGRRPEPDDTRGSRRQGFTPPSRPTASP